MMKKYLFGIVILMLAFPFIVKPASDTLKLGADRMNILLPLLENNRVALVVNQTSCLSNGIHLLDTLLKHQVQIVKVFAPEHGFRGDADAGETIRNGKDANTGIRIISLYGNNKKPKKESLADVDIVVFDIQDVGARFYTYISTMHYVMEACAENDKKCIILDRPNPNDHIDGPVLEPEYKSFVGIHPVPVLHGLTVGELARMINGEGWLQNSKKCDLTIVELEGWKHKQPYSLLVKPSPNLPNDQAIKLYPSLCFFEATNISVGRGTYFPFQIIGFPDSKYGVFTFMPKSLVGFDKNPMHKDKLCYGLDLRDVKSDGSLTLKYLLSFYRKSGLGSSFFKSPDFMDKLSGTNKLRLQIIEGKTEEQIRESWESDLKKYKNTRKKYLIYSD